MLTLDVELFMYSVIGVLILGAVGTGIMALYTAISKNDNVFDYSEMGKSFSSLLEVPALLVAKRMGMKKITIKNAFERYHAGPFNYLSIWMITISSMLTLILWAWWASNMKGAELPTQIWFVWGLTLALQAVGISMHNIYTTVHKIQEELGCEKST